MIRKYHNTDCDTVVQIWFEASMVSHSFISEEKLSSHKDDVAEIYLPKAETWVVESDGQVCGFISLVDNYIGALFIEPKMHRKKFGQQLIEKAKSIHSILSVGVYLKNESAIKFYAQMGFKYHSEELQEETNEIVINMIYDSSVSN